MNSKTASRNALLLTCLASALAATHPAMAQALEPVVRVSMIARDTVIGITLLLMTVGFLQFVKDIRNCDALFVDAFD